MRHSPLPQPQALPDDPMGDRESEGARGCWNSDETEAIRQLHGPGADLPRSGCAAAR